MESEIEKTLDQLTIVLFEKKNKNTEKKKKEEAPWVFINKLSVLVVGITYHKLQYFYPVVNLKFAFL